MVKKLDILILRSFTGPFLATFLIALFVLTMQFFWLYIDDLVGKGLDMGTLAYLTGLVAVTWVPLALPLALLLSSIMTFGNLGETFELVAIKSAGIPLIRFMRPLLIATIMLSGIAFLFANNIIPVANLKLNALKYDIIVKKPAFDIKEGIFYDKIDGYVIKIGKKDADDSTIHNVIIYEKNYSLQDHFMVAQSGVMRITPDQRFLEFELHNGWNYQENGNRYSPNTEFIRLGFKTYKKEFDLSTFMFNKTEDSLFKYDPKMLSLRQIDIALDSFEAADKVFYTRSQKDLKTFLSFLRYKDSSWSTVKKVQADNKIKTFDSIIPDSLRMTVFDGAISSLNSGKGQVELMASEYSSRQEMIRKHWIEWNRKLTLSFACIVLFMVGAPLGSIIRKGGLGTPLIFAIAFFVLFNMLNTFGEKFAKEGVTSVFTGMWLSTLVLVPIGLFLTYKAMRDSQLFNKEFYFRLFKKKSKEKADV
ncbi:YjgP/YjgQ family permease [Panacibacter ginsenosidivorans]|uniref:YjgP/YjgQ family permease n=1 Tax=Panacibacter ginsenosidivorans TaxID=1813871 RepID=A0A5B8V673_9BACT|nr:LptF/LptG family permease [Panacibacter ginsenosidivorans]QEC66997.1 YjgP/YjgQ family permease [Panacibacter ginsenosidivorans]